MVAGIFACECDLRGTSSQTVSTMKASKSVSRTMSKTSSQLSQFSAKMGENGKWKDDVLPMLHIDRFVLIIKPKRHSPPSLISELPQVGRFGCDEPYGPRRYILSPLPSAPV